MRALKFRTGHVIYNPVYTYKFQLKTTKATFPGIVNLFNDLVKINREGTPKNPKPDEWAHWEDLRRHVTEIYVMILQAASHLKPHHVI